MTRPRSKKINKGQRISVCRDIVRIEGPYANAGETGIVREVFVQRSHHEPKLYAKVVMDATGKIKTFRCTSLACIDSQE